jgi:hypothetical protein
MVLITQEHLLLSDLIYTVSCLKLKRETSAVRKTHFNLTGTDDEIANAAIDKTVAFHTMENGNYLTTRLIIQNS